MLGMKGGMSGPRPRARSAAGLKDVDAVIMDLDGVVTDTARLHSAAWKETFDEFLRQREERYGERHEAFTQEDYLSYVDGKPRCDGVRDFLASRGITLSEGLEDDPPHNDTVCGLGNRKNRRFLAIIEDRGVEPYPFVEKAIRSWRQRGTRLALVSASRNARQVLKMSSLARMFDAVVDGNDLAALRLRGKPAPDLFLEAARQLEVVPHRAAVIEDALAGVEAGRAGGFALVIGVDRGHHAADLMAHGADLVIEDLSSLVELRTEGLPSALDRSREIFKRLIGGQPAIFLDYDGTLSPIVARPDLATLSDDLRETLRRLARECPVYIVSGRGLDDVMKMVALDSLGYAGSHGFEIEGPGGSYSDRERGAGYLTALDDAERKLRPMVESIHGAIVERKRYALALHYRLVSPPIVPVVEAAFDKVARSHSELRRTSGKMVLELRPDLDWDKGNAVLSISDRLSAGRSPVVPLYIGDDLTDEDAFRAIGDKGITILVSDRVRPTAARYLLDDVAEVQVFLDRLVEGFESEGATDMWSLVYDEYRPGKEQLREALCTLGNGYMATRGSAPESVAGEHHYPGTYIAGIYNRLQSIVAGRVIENESIVNLPNWSYLSFRIAGGEWFDVDEIDIDGFRQELDMRSGVLVREVRFTDRQGRRTTVRQRRFVSMDIPNLAALETIIVPQNWSGQVTVRTALDGRIGNTLVTRYRALNNQHLTHLASGTEGDGTVWLEVETSQSHVRIAEAARTAVFEGQTAVNGASVPLEDEGLVGQDIKVAVSEGRPLRVEKVAAVHSSRDPAISESAIEARDLVAHCGNFAQLLEQHVRRWDMLWSRFQIEVDPGHVWISQILNLHVFHLLENASLHSIDMDAGIAPRGLAGEAYRGQVMWDELFIFPFLNLHSPDITRSLMLYRHRRLRRARWAARQEGYRGAMFPWQSGSDGREEAQTIHLNPLSGRWVPDNSHLEQHVSLAIAYNVWHYYQVTNDLNFMSLYGTELLCEIARFWVSRCTYDPARERYVILGVEGPDEFHEGYPGAPEPGVNNNAYTNVMVSWTLGRAMEALRELPLQYHRDVRAELSLEDEELDRWKEIALKIFVPFHGDGILSQFEGYDDLGELDMSKYRGKYCSLHRMDRILEAEGDSVRRYKVSKQADALMLLYLFSEDELREQLGSMGYSLSQDAVRKTIEYYSKRTAHGSTLSRVVYAWVLSRYNRESSWSMFLEALRSDVSDVQCGTTHEGIHLGAMASTVDIVQRCYSGLETRGDALIFDPRLPPQLKRLKFLLEYRRHLVAVEIDRERMHLSSRTSDIAPIAVGYHGRTFTLEPGGALEVLLDDDAGT
ncbi:MAG: trehalose-phosphatase [Methanomassiliicoccus sp.]|nr:trehalose-phosphatase [Methanomassiliicoccus sp.]